MESKIRLQTLSGWPLVTDRNSFFLVASGALGFAGRFLTGLHAPKDGIHHDHDQRDYCHGHPKAHVESEQIHCAKQRHPNILPIHREHLLLQQLAVVTNIGFFQAGRQHHIQQNAGDQIGKVGRRQCHKAQRCTKGGKGDDGQHRNAGHRQQRNGRGGAALDKGQLGRADHVDDQRLAPHRLDKPAGLEQPDILRLHHCQLCAAVMRRQVVEQHAARHKQRAEHKVHENIRCEVEDGAVGSDPNHKIANAGSIQLPGLGY